MPLRSLGVDYQQRLQLIPGRFGFALIFPKRGPISYCRTHWLDRSTSLKSVAGIETLPCRQIRSFLCVCELPLFSHSGQDILGRMRIEETTRNNRSASLRRERIGIGLRFLLALTVGLIAVVALPLGGHLFAVQFGRNEHVVVAGECYRSAQPDRDSLQDLVRRHGICSVLNLRGENVGNDWYQIERQTLLELGVQMIDFKISARHDLTDEQLVELKSILENAPRPMLIHCKAGSDRSGLASAMYKAIRSNRIDEASRSQLSLHYGHLSIPIFAEYAMDRSLDRFAHLMH
jgi:protein tyrosine phosphatase (PTP) superfamily phosphohydrolase (DUF442 family)